MKTIFTLLLCLITSPLFAQIERSEVDIVTETFYQLQGVESAQRIGDRVLLESTKGLGTRQVGIVEVFAEPVDVEAEDSKGVRFKLEKVDSRKVTLEDGGETIVTSYVIEHPGTYELRFLFIDWENRIPSQQTETVTIGSDAPGPQPDPKPDPEHPAPIPEAGFRVVIVYETAELTRIPREQQNQFFSTTIRDYLRKKCVKDDSGNPEFRIVDKDAVFAKETPIARALKRPRSELPWIIISTGKTGFEGSLPATEAETLELLKKYGGE